MNHTEKRNTAVNIILRRGYGRDANLVASQINDIHIFGNHSAYDLVDHWCSLWWDDSEYDLAA